MLHSNRITFMIGPILWLVATALLTACSAGDSPSGSFSPPPDQPLAGTTVRVSVKATDIDNDQLHYRWAVTEGTIQPVDARTTTWTVPKGSGFQFVYVVVSDGKGGFTEQRGAALTFDPPAGTSTAAPVLTPPAPTGAPGFVWGSVYSRSFNRDVYLPGVKISLLKGSLQVGATVETDMKGQFFLSGLPDDEYEVRYTIPGQSEVAFPTTNKAKVRAANKDFPTSPNADTYFHGEVTFPGAVQVAGSVRLADQTFCGIRNEFFTRSGAPNLFDKPVAGTAQLLNEQGQPLSAAVSINHYGDYLLVPNEPVGPSTTAKVKISCGIEEKISNTFTVTSKTIVPTIQLENHRPVVEPITILQDGRDEARPDLPKPRTLFESVDKTPPTFGDEDLIAEIIHTPGDDTFFTYKGIDTRKSACAYYKAIGAVQGCDADGFPTGAQLTLAQWRSKFNLSTVSNSNLKIAPNPDDGREIRLQYVNSNDLNLGRDMQAIKLADGTLAYNTCNYPGSQDVTLRSGAPKEIGKETQPDIDRAIANARDGIGLIVCVAMDDSAIPGINGGQPFAKFYTFGPTGKLLLSVSLDGRREKFMPGTCTTCHGGDAYGGQFPDDGSGRPDLISRWQPFDMANLRLSSSQDRSQADAVVKIFNQRLLDSKIVNSITTQRTRDLIANWYKDGRLDQDPDFIPEQIKSLNLDLNTYKKVIQPDCQTCHAAQTPKGTETLSKRHVCGGDRDLEQSRTMTNTLVPFERFWLDPALPPLLGCGTRPAKHPAL